MTEMTIMKVTLLALLALFVLFACKASSTDTVTPPPDMTPPEWSRNAVIYEVNVRQFTPQGTFAAFAEHLPRLRELGVDILWFMPIHPIGELNRKGSLGSYYSVRDYRAVNPEFGTMDDWRALVQQCHELGFKVIIDWVANHSAWDNPLTVEHPEWYTRDNAGNFVPPVPDWSDVIDFNFDNPDLRNWMIESLKFWVRESNIDGYRCDVAGMVPLEFWQEATRQLLELKPVFMLAEHEAAEYHSAFHATYGWEFFHKCVDVARGERVVNDLFSYIERDRLAYTAEAYRMYFTSNHDENSWNGTEFERFGNAAKPFAVLSFTAPGFPLIYNGQEAGFNRRLLFFEKDSIDWASNDYAAFYQKLVALKHRHPSLRNGASGAPLVRVQTSGDAAAMCFQRTSGTSRLVVLINTSQTGVNFTLTDESIAGNYREVLTEETTTLTGHEAITLAAGVAKVFESVE